MWNSGKKFSTLRDKKIEYSNCCEKKNLNKTKNHNPPLQVKWSVPKGLNIKSIQHCSIPILWSKNKTNGP